MSDAPLIEEGRRARRSRVMWARQDPAAFCEYVLRNEETGKRIKNAPFHAEWHDLIDANRRLIIWSAIEQGKTSQIAIGRTLYEAGKNPNIRIVIAANTGGQATKTIRSISRYMEKSAPLSEVFPRLKPSLPWTQSQLTVERSTFAKDPTVQAIGVHGQVIGSRIDLLIVDDILDWENTRTKQHREELLAWFRSEIVGRLTADSRVVFIGNAYVPDDLLHTLAKEGIYVQRTYPVLLPDGTPRWPEAWPVERIKKLTEELGGEGSPEVARQLFCVPRTEESSRCKKEWITRCLTRGLEIELLDSLSIEEIAGLGGATTHVGVDIGVKRGKKSAKTVVFGLLAWPDGTKQVIHCRSGRWMGAQITSETLHAVTVFNAKAHVEDNGAQNFILQAAHGELTEGVGDEGFKLTVLPFHTGGNKTHPIIGVESVFVELARGQWIIPSVETPTGELKAATPELEEWVNELLNYSPERHTGDHHMASWFAREGARLSHAREHSQEASVRIVGQDITDSDQVEAGAHPKSDTLADKLRGWQALLRPDRR